MMAESTSGYAAARRDGAYGQRVVVGAVRFLGLIVICACVTCKQSRHPEVADIKVMNPTLQVQALDILHSENRLQQQIR